MQVFVGYKNASRNLNSEHTWGTAQAIPRFHRSRVSSGHSSVHTSDSFCYSNASPRFLLTIVLTDTWWDDNQPSGPQCASHSASVIVFSVAVGMWENQCRHPTSVEGSSTGPNPALLGDMLSHIKGKKLIVILVAVESNFKKALPRSNSYIVIF